MDTPTGSSYGSDAGRVPAEAPGRVRHIASGRRGESDAGAVPRELAATPVYPRAPPPAALLVARSVTTHACERGGGGSSSRVPPAWPDTVVVADLYAYRPRVFITHSSLWGKPPVRGDTTPRHEPGTGREQSRNTLLRG